MQIVQIRLRCPWLRQSCHLKGSTTVLSTGMTESGSFGSSDQEGSSEEEESLKNSNKNGKDKRTRNMNPKSKWTKRDEIKY